MLPGSLLAGQADLAAGIPAGYELAKLAIGVRPESVRLAEKGLPARVIAAEYLGADTQVETRVNDETVMVRTPGRSRRALTLFEAIWTLMPLSALVRRVITTSHRVR
jgi:sn-glycerol 3-phosphate transport system ATP-binding protein